MDANLTILDLFRLILFLLGIGALTFLILALKNITGILGQINKIINDNSREIDRTIKQLPEISENVNAITHDTKQTVKELTPEINGLLHNINSISGKVEGITNFIDDTTHKVGDTVGLVSDTISDTATSFRFNVNNIADYIVIIKEIFESIKKYINKL